MEKMNPEVKRKWIEALRSGKYPQEAGALRTSVGFCCLGVLCDLSGKGSWADGGGYGNEIDGFEPSYLPDDVMRWAGVGVTLPKVDAQIVRDVLAKHQFPEPEVIELDVRIGDGIAVGLASLNDSGVPFNIIADIIEEAL